MADFDPSRPISPSLLDRLIDDNPGASVDPPKSRAQALRDLRRAVRRDLEGLLNSRQTIVDWTSDLDEIELSLLDYGIPDLSGLNLGSPQARETFRALVQERIRKLEPRFKTVEVQLVTNAEPVDKTLRFRINAWLNVEPAPERVEFDSLLEPVSRAFEVKGGGGE